MDQDQQFTYGVVREGVIAENIPQISAKFLQTFRRITAPFPGNETHFFANFRDFLQNFRKLSAKKKPFANDPILLSELLTGGRNTLQKKLQPVPVRRFNFPDLRLRQC